MRQTRNELRSNWSACSGLMEGSNPRAHLIVPACGRLFALFVSHVTKASAAEHHQLEAVTKTTSYLA
jgi:hypothetical protein